MDEERKLWPRDVKAFGESVPVLAQLCGKFENRPMFASTPVMTEAERARILCDLLEEPKIQG